MGLCETTHRVKRPEVERSLSGAEAPPTAFVRLADGGAAVRSIGDRQTGAVAIVSAHAQAELVADQQTRWLAGVSRWTSNYCSSHR